jgi:hypothetical protein
VKGKNGLPVLSAAAIAYAKEHAAQVFDDRRGHNGGAKRVLISRTEFEDHIAIACEQGKSQAASLARVKS